VLVVPAGLAGVAFITFLDAAIALGKSEVSVNNALGSLRNLYLVLFAF